MYHVSADDRFPYRVCGGQQESGSACVRSRGDWGAITQRDWHTAGAQEYGYVIPDPLHPGVFFGGKVERFVERTGQTQEVSPIALPSKTYRVVRTEPLAFDRFDQAAACTSAPTSFSKPTTAARTGARSVPTSRARIPACRRCSDAFDSDDPQHGTHRGVVYAIAPSYRRRGTIWAGTDDGLVWITRDGGAPLARRDAARPRRRGARSRKSTRRASTTRPPSSRSTGFASTICARTSTSRTTAARTGSSRSNGLPDQPVNAVRQDPQEPRLLYAATENGVYVSFDAGAHWQSLQLELPHTSVRDIIVHGNDAIVATHGRGFWILDDVTPLRALARERRPDCWPRGAYLFRARTRRIACGAARIPIRRCRPRNRPGENPPDGAILDYALAAERAPRYHHDRRRRADVSSAATPATIRHRRRFPISTNQRIGSGRSGGPATGEGMHRFVWDLREPATARAIARICRSRRCRTIRRAFREGPLVSAGTLHGRRSTSDGTSPTQPLTVAMDPRVSITPAQLRHQYAFRARSAPMMDRSFRDAAAAKSRGPDADVRLFESINDAAGVSARHGRRRRRRRRPRQAVAASSTLSGRLEEFETRGCAKTRVAPHFLGTSHGQTRHWKGDTRAMNALRLALAARFSPASRAPSRPRPRRPPAPSDRHDERPERLG